MMRANCSIFSVHNWKTPVSESSVCSLDSELWFVTPAYASSITMKEKERTVANRYQYTEYLSEWSLTHDQEQTSPEPCEPRLLLCAIQQ